MDYNTQNLKKSNDNKRTRNRVPISCFACRKKKIKCDKRKPHCGSCIINGSTDFCNYEAQPWQTHSDTLSQNEVTQSEIECLRAKIKMLEKIIGSQSRQLEIYAEMTSNSSNTSSIKWMDNTVEVNNGNVSLNLSKYFDGFTVKDSKLMYFGPTSYMSLLMNDKYAVQVFSEYTREQLINFNEFFDFQNTRPLDINPSNKVKDTNEVSETITNELPPLMIINLLLKRFFQICYPFVPFIDENSFIAEISSILKDMGNYTKINSNGGKHHSTIAILLIILRFAYITLPLRDYYSNKLHGLNLELINEIMDNKTNISPAYVDCANRLVMSSGCLREISLRTIQALLLLRVYKMYCPEDDDYMSDIGIIQGIIIQVARYRGMNKDPTRYPKSLVDYQGMYIWRKIWTQISYLDASQAFNFGSQLLIQTSESDNNLTTITNNFDMLSVQQDKPSIIRQYTIMAMVTRPIRKIVEIIGNNDKVKRSELIQLLDELNDIIHNKIRTFQQLYNCGGMMFEGNAIDRAQEFVLRIDLLYKVYTTNFILFSTADNESEIDLQKKYLALALENALIILRIGYEYAENSSSMFGSELETLVASCIWKAIQRIAASICTVLFRVLENEYSLIEASNYFKTPDSSGLVNWIGIDYSSEEISIKNLVSRFEHIYLKCEDLSARFFTCYKVVTIIRYVLNHIQKNYPNLLTSYKEKNFSTKKQMSPLDTNKGNRDFLNIEQFWNKKKDFDSLLDFDYLLSHLNDGLDPFLNDTPAGIDFTNLNSSGSQNSE